MATTSGLLTMPAGILHVSESTQSSGSTAGLLAHPKHLEPPAGLAEQDMLSVEPRSLHTNAPPTNPPTAPMDAQGPTSQHTAESLSLHTQHPDAAAVAAPIPTTGQCVTRVNRDTIPTIYVHVGPAKTGTTSLQNHLACNSKVLRETYNVHFMGKRNDRDVSSCDDVPKHDFVRPVVQYKNKRAMAKLQKQLVQHTQEGSSAVLSDEGFLNIPDLLVELFNGLMMDASITNNTNASRTNDAPFLITPVVVYRRYHDWLVSAYRFMYKPKWYENGWKSWGKVTAIPTFVEFWHKQVQGQTKPQQYHPGLRSAERMIQLLSLAENQSTIRVPTTKPQTLWTCPQVLDIHAGDPVTQFLSMLGGARNNDKIPKHTKQPAPSKVGLTRIANAHSGNCFEVDAEILALHLKAEGLLHHGRKRRTVVELLTRKLSSVYLNTTNTPWDCPSDQEAEVLLHQTLRAEESFLSMTSRPSESPRAAEKSFQEARVAHKFCNLHIGNVLQHPGFSGNFRECLKQGGDSVAGV